MLLTKDHKRIGILYLLAISAMFVLGGLYAALIPWNLLVPDGSHMSADTYNKTFTAHGVIMVFFFLIPSIPAVFGNFLLPLMIGAKDLAFPKLNLILLRDDKSYPYLKLTVNEQWPRLEVVRRVQKDKARYFGPYVPAGAMWETLAFIRNQYRIPNCRYSLDKRMRPCIQYQIKKCIGPCSGEVDREAYLQMIREVELLLRARTKS